MDENKNLAIWEQVEKTNPSVTKRVAMRGGFTAICAQSQVKEATKLFGPIGIGWGIKEQTIFSIGPTLIYQAILWYVFQGGGGEYPIAANIGVDQDDCVKKVRTAAVTKGLSWLGFNSDVFEGKFDDNAYVDTRKKEVAKAGSNPDAVETAVEAKKNEKIAHARAKEADGKLNRGEINTLVFEAENKAHASPHERVNSRLKHLGYDSLTSPDIDAMRGYYQHLLIKIKEKEKADAESK